MQRRNLKKKKNSYMNAVSLIFASGHQVKIAEKVIYYTKTITGVEVETLSERFLTPPVSTKSPLKSPFQTKLLIFFDSYFFDCSTPKMWTSAVKHI